MIGKSSHKNRHGHTNWLCRCSCGNYTSLTTGNINIGNTISCGCFELERYLSQIGQRYGKIIVIDILPKLDNYYYLKCKCDCGTICSFKGLDIRNGDILSCGWQPCRPKGMIRDTSQYRIITAKTTYENMYNDGDITFEQFMKLSQEPCYYCGVMNSNSFNRYSIKRYNNEKAKENGWFHYNGLDRIDSSKPHLLDNVVPCCKVCNFMKNKYSQEDFLNQVFKILNHLKENDNANKSRSY